MGRVWIIGGNTFVLRQAMKLSWFGDIIKDEDFLYEGYIAVICILASSLKGLSIVDNPDIHPCEELKKTILEGLIILDYLILPDYKSDYPELEDIDKKVEYCKKIKLL